MYRGCGISRNFFGENCSLCFFSCLGDGEWFSVVIFQGFFELLTLFFGTSEGILPVVCEGGSVVDIFCQFFFWVCLNFFFRIFFWKKIPLILV